MALTNKQKANISQISGMDAPKSRGTWGREAYKTDEELNAACRAYLDAVVVPKEWRRDGFDRCVDTGIRTEHYPNGSVTSISVIYTDTRTKGFDIKRYKVVFLVASGMGAICQRSINRITGKPIYLCTVTNKTAEKLNEFIKQNYFRLERPHRWWKFTQPIKRKRL